MSELTDGQQFLLDDYDKQCRRTARTETVNADLAQLVKDMLEEMVGTDRFRKVSTMYRDRPESWQHRAFRVLADLTPIERP